MQMVMGSIPIIPIQATKELDSVILAGPFQLGTLCDPVDSAFGRATDGTPTAQFLSCQKDVAEIEVAQRRCQWWEWLAYRNASTGKEDR